MSLRTPLLVMLALLARGAPNRPAEANATTVLPPTITTDSLPAERAGISIAGAGGLAGLVRLTVIDSASARYVTVTRRACSGLCTPIDSASGTLRPEDVAHVFAVVAEERVFSLRDDYAECGRCPDEAFFETTVTANGRRKAITSDRETTPEILGRVHVAVAEAIRAARGDN